MAWLGPCGVVGLVLFWLLGGARALDEDALERLLAAVSAAEASKVPLQLQARRNGVAEAVNVSVPVPSWLSMDNWLSLAIQAVRNALSDAPLPERHVQLEDAQLPADIVLYTGDGLGPLQSHHIARLREGTVVAVIGAGRPFIWPAVPGAGRFTSPRAPLVGGRAVELEAVSAEPRVFRVHNLLTEEECDELVKGVAHLEESHGLARSTTGGKRSAGGMQVNNIRTSDNAFDVDSKIAQRVMHRGLGLLGIPWDFRIVDGLQIVRYAPGQAYKEHSDAFPASFRDKSGHDYDSTAAGTNRMATVFMYCSSPPEGGQTVFPRAVDYSPAEFPSTWQDRRSELQQMASNTGMSQPWELRMVETCHSKFAVRPRRGDGVIFYSQHVDGRIDDRAEHGGCPVLEGVKWSANLWVWNGPRDGTQSYYKNSKDATIRSDFRAGRVTILKHGRQVGTLAPGEEATFHMHFGQTWIAIVSDTNKTLTGWKVSGKEPKVYAVPPQPDASAASFSFDQHTHKPKGKEQQPSVSFQNARTSRVWIFWLHPETGAESRVADAEPGQSVQMNTFHGHVFRVRDSMRPGGGRILTEFTVAAEGKSQTVRIPEEHPEA